MKYTRPGIALMASAMSAIQSGTCNKGTASVDSHGCMNNHVTIGAYEADE
jgi:hypothetical protein